MIFILHLANWFSEEVNLPLSDCWVCFHHVVVLWCTGQDLQTLEVLPCSRAHYSCVLQHNLCQAGSAFLYQCGTFLNFHFRYFISLYSKETFLLAQFAGWNTLLEKNSINTGKWKWSAQLSFWYTEIICHRWGIFHKDFQGCLWIIDLRLQVDYCPQQL